MAAVSELLYRLGIEGDGQVKAAFDQMGEAEQRAAERAINAANRKSDAIGDSERRLEAVRAASGRADEKALAMMTGTTAVYESNQRALRAQTQVEGQAIVVRDRATNSLGQMRAGSQQLSFQIQDVTQQFALGVSPMVIFAQQGGQVVQALDLMMGGGNRFISFMAGPWGAVLLGATMIIGGIITALNSGADAAAAKKGAVEDLTTAIGNLNDATKQQTQSEYAARDATLANAGALRQQALDARVATAEQIRLARARVAANLAQAGRFDGRGDGGTGAAAGSAALAAGGELRLRELDKLLAKNEVDLQKAAVTFRQAFVPVMEARVRDSMDASAAATGRFEQAMDRLDKQFTTTRMSREDYLTQARALATTRDAEIKTAEAATGAAGGRSRGLAEVARAERQAVAEAKEYAASLLQLQDRYDPLTASARRYRDELAKIKDAADRGDIDAPTAETYRAGARRTFETEQMRATGADEAVRNAIRIAEQFRRLDEQQQQRQSRVLSDQQDAITLAERELQLIGANDNFRDAELNKLRLILGIQRDFPGATDAWVAKLLEGEMVLEALNRETQRQAMLLGEMNDVGGNFVDSVLDPQNWRSWGEAGQSILRELMQDVWRLAAINPLKNWLFGSELPTMNGLLGLLGGGGGVPVADNSLAYARFAGALGVPAPGNAAGTYDFRGGWTRVGENGPENVYLPSRSQIMRSSLSRQREAANDQGGRALHVTVTKSALFEVAVEEVAAPMMSQAMVQGAAGGAQIAQAEMNATARRRLGSGRWG